MRGRVLMAVALALVAACRRHRGASRRMHDPRAEFATGCPDARYVTAPARLIATATSAVTRLALVRARDRDAALWSTTDSAFLWREGAEPVRVAGAVRDVALASVASRVLCAWVDAAHGAVQVAAVDGEGRVEAWPPFATNVRELAVMGAPSHALAAWTEGDAPHARVMVRRLDARGRASGGATLAAEGSVDGVALTWTGARYVLVWRVPGHIMARTVAVDGVAGAAFVVVRVNEGMLGRPSVAWGGGRLAVTWSDPRNGALGLQVATTDLRGRPSEEPQRLSIRYTPEARASLVWDGAAFGLSWWEPVGGGAPRVYFALVGRDGRRIGTAMRVFENDGVALTLPALTWARPDYSVVTVRDGTSIELRRTGPRGCDAPPDGR